MRDIIELTILMPCLNEEKTIGGVIREAKKFIENNKIKAEILIADNNSTDASRQIAEGLGARVVIENKKGYGNALRKGINEAYGKYIIFGDADLSYDFEHLEHFLEKLRIGYDLVMGNRFKGGIEKGAMPFSHKIGVPILSFIGKIISGAPVNDFHCGLRGLAKEKVERLGLKTEGMEFATELIFKSARAGHAIIEIPTVLRKDQRECKSHLNTIKDGIRHLVYMLKNIKIIKVSI